MDAPSNCPPTAPSASPVRFVAYVGNKSAEYLSAYLNGHQVAALRLQRLISPDVSDLRENLQALYNALDEAYHHGYRHVVIFNYDMGLPVGLVAPSMRLIKGAYPGLEVHYSTHSPQGVWQADAILYDGVNIFETIEGKRLRYGSILDASGTNILSQPYQAPEPQ